MRIPPGRVEERIGDEAYAKLDETDLGVWWVGLPDFIPPPEDWTP